MSELPVMIFAAGFGTRMGDLTRSTPKPLIKVAGKALIDHAIALTGTRHVVVNTHYHADQMQAHLGDLPNITLSHEAPDILETGGGLKRARGALGADTVLTLNSDAIWAGPNPLDMLCAAWDPDRMDALMLMIRAPHMIGFTRKGDFRINADQTLSRDPEGLVYTGAQIVKTEGLDGINTPAFSLNLLWNALEDKKTLFGLNYPGQLADVGTPEGIGLAQDLLQKTHHV